jgi:hypothetical protein
MLVLDDMILSTQLTPPSYAIHRVNRHWASSRHAMEPKQKTEPWLELPLLIFTNVQFVALNKLMVHDITKLHVLL